MVYFFIDKNKFERLEEHLKKDLELIKKLKQLNNKLYSSKVISTEEYITYKKKIDLLEGKIRKILSLLNNLKIHQKIYNFIQDKPLPQKIKDFHKNKIEYYEKSIKKTNLGKILIKRDLLSKLEKRKKLKELKKIKELGHKHKKKNFLKLKIGIKNKINLEDSKTINRIFDFFLFNFPFIYIPILEFLVKLNFDYKQARLFATIYTIVFIFLTYLAATYLALLFLYLFNIISDVGVVIKLMKILFIIGILVVFLSIFYPYYTTKQKAQEINDLLPFVLVHMSAISMSGINFYQVIKMIAETREYKIISEEFEKIVLLVDYGGMNLFDAINLVAEETPSNKLKEILKSLVYILKSGGDVDRYLQQMAQEAIMNLKINKEKYIGFLDVFSDLYVILIVAIPILFISIIAILGSFSPSEKLYKFAKFATFVIIPLLDLGFLILLNMHKSE